MVAHAVHMARAVSHLVDSTWEECSVAGVQFSSADDDESEPEGQAKGTVQKLLKTRV